ncbi:hypothetical protein NEL65_16655 [Escherichia coli]|nr:hypothetical protein [Escherichia coli]MDI0978379.1 hypothetical protein [Escherichia coli]MDI0983303.1 hypothetical protein [Escherichia coli]
MGHYDAGNLRGSTLFLPTPASYSNSWDAFITFSLFYRVICLLTGETLQIYKKALSEISVR